jgi:hypothetical protein
MMFESGDMIITDTRWDAVRFWNDPEFQAGFNEKMKEIENGRIGILVCCGKYQCWADEKLHLCMIDGILGWVCESDILRQR